MRSGGPSIALVITSSMFFLVLARFPISGQATTPVPGESKSTAEVGGSTGVERPTPGEAGSVSADATQAARHPETYLEFAVAGGYLMIPIGIFSVLLVAVLAERLTTSRRSRVLPTPFARAIKGLPGDGRLDHTRAKSICSAHPSSAARILEVALGTLGRSREEIDAAVNSAAQREIYSLRRYVRLFAVMAGVAPLIGLLGTVTGMIQAFREVAIQGLGSGQALAPGIYKALVTTAGGLLVAIPALIIYHWLNSRIDNYVHAIDNLVVDFVEANGPRRESEAREAAVTT